MLEIEKKQQQMNRWVSRAIEVIEADKDEAWASATEAGRYAFGYGLDMPESLSAHPYLVDAFQTGKQYAREEFDLRGKIIEKQKYNFLGQKIQILLKDALTQAGIDPAEAVPGEAERLAYEAGECAWEADISMPDFLTAHPSLAAAFSRGIAESQECYDVATGAVTTIKDLNADQRAALMTFRAQNGRSWKQKLLAGWQRAAYPGALQQIRNQFGPEWLTKLKHVPDYRLDVTVKTADGCVGTYSVALDNRGQPKDGPITWSPQEPDAETDSVAIKCYDGDELKQEYVTEGDLWRALEDGDLHDELWDNVLKGQPLAEAIEAMPVSDNKCRI